MASAGIRCELCSKKDFLYICPRCNIKYCSLPCYKSEAHSQCSEEFYKNQVLQHVAFVDPEVAKDNAKKMTDVLVKHRAEDEENELSEYDFKDILNDEAEDSCDSDDDVPLEMRIEGIDLNDSEELWSKLTAEEREEFKKLVHKDDTENLIPEWVPWWTIEPPKIVEISSSTLSPELSESQPKIITPILSLKKLSKSTPDVSVKYGLLNVIGSYTWISRLYAGSLFDIYEPPIWKIFLKLSSYMKDDRKFVYFDEAVADIKFNVCQNPDELDGGEGILNCLEKDIKSIMTSNSSASNQNSFVLSALSELVSLFSSHPKIEGGNFSETFIGKKDNLSIEDKKEKLRVKRKLEYLLSYVNEYHYLSDIII